jgi:hypothetical protein
VTSETWDGRVAVGYHEASADMFAPEVLRPAVDFLEGLAPGGRALEFAIGTGRVALPLRACGLSVSGLIVQSRWLKSCAENREAARFVVEVFVPDIQRLPIGSTARSFHIEENRVGFDTYDLVRQQLV